MQKKVALTLIKPVTIQISTVITRNGERPGGYRPLDQLLMLLNKAITVQNSTTWKEALIQFAPVDRLYKVSGHADLFNLGYESRRKTREVRTLQRDPHRFDLYLVNDIVSADGFCAGATSWGQDLGCVISSETIGKWSGRILSNGCVSFVIVTS